MNNSHTKQNNQCLLKAADNEPIFVLRAQDKSAPAVIAYWMGLNPTISDDKADDAIDVMHEMKNWPNRKVPD